MYRHITILSAVAAFLGAQAQPTLTFPGNAPVPDANIGIILGQYIAPGPGGAEVVWDMSALVPTTTNEIQRLAPASTPNGAVFPNATVAYSNDGVYMYFQGNANGVFQLGTDDGMGTIINYTDPGQYMQFPCTYLTSWTDEATASFSTEGFDVERTVSISATADGYGTLITPSGTFNDVLRLHWVESIVDSNEFLEVLTENDSYVYYVPGNAYPVVQTVTTTIEMMGNVITEQYTQWVDELSTGVAQGHAHSVGVSVYPNPATDMLEIMAEHGPIASIMLADASGRIVMTKDASNTSRISLDVQGLERGAYILTCFGPAGEQSVQRVVLQ